MIDDIDILMILNEYKLYCRISLDSSQAESRFNVSH